MHHSRRKTEAAEWGTPRGGRARLRRLCPMAGARMPHAVPTVRRCPGRCGVEYGASVRIPVADGAWQAEARRPRAGAQGHLCRLTAVCAASPQSVRRGLSPHDAAQRPVSARGALDLGRHPCGGQGRTARPAGPVVGDHREPWREPLGLGGPVRRHRRGCHDQRRPVVAGPGAVAARQEGKDLHGPAEPRVIHEDAAPGPRSAREASQARPWRWCGRRHTGWREVARGKPGGSMGAAAVPVRELAARRPRRAHRPQETPGISIGGAAVQAERPSARGAGCGALMERLADGGGTQ